MTPLLGIAKGTADWLDIYDRMRAGLATEDATANYLDDALARAVAVEPLRVLSYFHTHPKIAAARIAGRRRPQMVSPRLSWNLASYWNSNDASAASRRSRTLRSSRSGSPALRPPAPRCGGSFGFYFVVRGEGREVAWRASVERRRAPRARGGGRARSKRCVAARAGDGSFPDGPFRVKQVPRGALDLRLEGHEKASRTPRDRGSSAI